MSHSSPIFIDVPEILDGPRVQLRRIRAADAPVITEAVLESRERLKPWMPWAHSQNIAESTRMYAVQAESKWLLRESFEMGIYDRRTGQYLGGMGIPRLSWAVRSFEIGYWLRNSAEGHGYMQEAVKLLTRMAFEVLGANRVEIQMDTRNVRSANVPRRLGFKLEGTLRNSGLDGYNQASDRLIYALTPEDYRRLDWRGQDASVSRDAGGK